MIPDPANVASLQLAGEVDDGCVIWVNGIEVARVNPGTGWSGDPLYNEFAANANPEPTPIEVVVPTLDSGLLFAGDKSIMKIISESCKMSWEIKCPLSAAQP